MKLKQNIYAFFALLSLLTSCGLDNVDAPASKLRGKITYNGATIGVKGTDEAVRLQAYQDGYDLDTPFEIFVKQDGTFEATVFDGVYKIVSRDNNGPWLNTRDTVVVTVKGASVCEYPVTPYYMIESETITLSGNTLHGSCLVKQIAGDKAIERVMLLLSKTSFVDDVCQIARQDLEKPQPGPLDLSMDVSSHTAEHALFARIGVKIEGVGDALYSTVVRLK